MKLEEAVDIIREKISDSIDKSLSKIGLFSGKEFSIDNLEPDEQSQKRRMKDIVDNLELETGSYASARDKLLEELTFTLFNRIAGLKVIEASGLQPEVITCRTQHGGRSFGHKVWLEQYQHNKKLPLEGLQEYIRYAFNQISAKIQLYSSQYLYDFLPDAYDLKDIINEFNNIEYQQWESDDIMGWLYESYNRNKRQEFKDKGGKIEYNWVSVTSQIYTPRWVVEFILNNSLGKLWMEMHPDSTLKTKHDIANIPEKPIQKSKPVKDIKVIDPAVGSGNFLLYAFDLFYEMYQEEGKHSEEAIPRLIIENNLYGVDLDDRSVQIARLGLFIKALKKNKNIQIDKMNIVSTDFYLPEYTQVKDLFERLIQTKETVALLEDIWEDLRVAYKFGSLIQIEEKISKMTNELRRTGQSTLWGGSELTFWDDWKEKVFDRITEVLDEYSSDSNGNMKFFKTKTKDSMVFADIISKKYDIAVANPPYTDSGNYGIELKQFITKNYKKPLSFYSNLYAVFLKRCSDLINKNGKIGMIHPPTFMYIKTFEDVRKFLLDQYHINVFIEWGYLGIFNPLARVDSAIYILEKNNQEQKSVFIKLNDLYEMKRRETLFKAFSSFLNNKEYKLLFLVNQKKLKLIEGYPFIYWISDNLREKFSKATLKNYCDVVKGITTSDNARFLRYLWEIDKNNVAKHCLNNKKTWFLYSKGGPFNKWYGNFWLFINWFNNGEELKKYRYSVIRNEKYFFKKGITYTSSGTKGVSFRYLPENYIIDAGGSLIYERNERNQYNFYILGFLNSVFSYFVTKCLNPTVNINQGDLKRIPYILPTQKIEKNVSLAANKNVEIKKLLCEYSIIENNYKYNPIMWAKEHDSFQSISKYLKIFLDYENELNTEIYLNEALIDELIFQVYRVTVEDKKMILEKEGLPIGSLSLTEKYSETSSQLLPEVENYVKELEKRQIDKKEEEYMVKRVLDLYQQDYSLEDICKELAINPISASGIIKGNKILPQKRSQEIIQDLLFDLVRELLEEQSDGIIPLIKISGEDTLQYLIYHKLAEKGFSHLQVEQIKQVLGTSFENYLEKYFFRDLANRLNLFMHLPKTPFIWHLSSGENQGFEAYVSIYKWNRDNLFRLKSVYLEKRESSLKNRLSDLSDNREELELKFQKEKDLIREQLKEIESFKQKIDEILETDYEPKLDDGVGKNIAPLQAKGLLKCEVLKKKELDKYLKADW